MRGLLLDFTKPGGAVFTANVVNGFAATVQNILVAIGQKEGSDIIYAKKGNVLHDNAVSGGLVSPEMLEIALQDLATTLQAFTDDFDEVYNTDKLAALDIDVDAWDSDKARLVVTATSSNGETVGATTVT